MSWQGACGRTKLFTVTPSAVNQDFVMWPLGHFQSKLQQLIKQNPEKRTANIILGQRQNVFPFSENKARIIPIPILFNKVLKVLYDKKRNEMVRHMCSWFVVFSIVRI
jgi:hypothetical protein